MFKPNSGAWKEVGRMDNTQELFTPTLTAALGRLLRGWGWLHVDKCFSLLTLGLKLSEH